MVALLRPVPEAQPEPARLQDVVSVCVGDGGQSSGSTAPQATPVGTLPRGVAKVEGSGRIGKKNCQVLLLSVCSALHGFVSAKLTFILQHLLSLARYNAPGRSWKAAFPRTP
jgi:hypothetical protein